MAESGLKFEVYADVESYLAAVKKYGEQEPYAEQIALNNTANIVRAALQNKIKEVFDRPTKRTINSPWIQYADKKQPDRFVLIGVNDKDTRSTKSGKSNVTPADYLRAQIEGGKRNHKASERAVFNYTAFPAMGGKGTKYLVPSKYAPNIDQYGNIPGSAITKILANIQGLHDTRSNTPKGKRGKAGGYFIHKTKPIIMMRQGDKAVPVLVGVKSISYEKRLPWYETLDKVWNANIEAQLQSALAHAAATAFK